MQPTKDGLVAALEETWRATEQLAVALEPDEWHRPTGCPGWSVKDNVAHIAGLESYLLGRPAEPHEVRPDLPHVRNEAGAFMEVMVDLRRPWPTEQLLAEYRDVTAERLAFLRALDADLDTEIQGIMGAAPMGRVLPIRVFDCWAHEQDIRRAVDRPGNLEGEAARVSVDRLLKGLAYVLAKQLEAPAGTTVVFDITGPTARTVTLGIRAGRGEVLDETPAAPDVRLTMHLNELVTLGCGRSDARPDLVTVDGDEDLGRRIVDNMAVTP